MMGYGLYKELLGGRPTTEPLTASERIKLEALSLELNAAIRSIRAFKKRAKMYLDSDETKEHN
jgi:hypothetical protein